MFLKYIAILLAVSAVVLAAKKERDEYQQRPSGGCPCADTYGRGDLQDGEPCGRKERKAFEKMQEKKFKPRRAYEDEDDDDVFPDMTRSSRWTRDYPEEDDEFVIKRDSKPRKQKKDKKYKREQYEMDDEMDPEMYPTSSVSPPCQRYVNDVNKLAKCERRLSEKGGERKKTFEGERGGAPEYPAVCQQFAYDPYKLIKCVRKTNFWADFGKHPADFEDPQQQQQVHPECQTWAHDPYKLSKCEFKLKKFAGDNMKKSTKGFY